MKTTKTLLLIGLAVALAACGDNLQRPDARKPLDGPPADAQCSNCPAAPALGTQIDRMGRPAINTALNHTFDPPGTANDVAAGAAKDAYNANADMSTWNSTATESQFEASLALLDSLDTNLCGNGACEFGEIGTGGTCPISACVTCADCTAGTAGASPVGVLGGGGCGNQADYNDSPTGGGSPGVDSYKSLADLLLFDELYVDTSKTDCEFYLAVEFGVVTSGANETCGGRAPQYDVMDFSLSMLAMGINGFIIPGFVPKFGDGASAHADLTPTSFPYLGTPH